MSDLYWEENFERDDSTTVGNDWSATGSLQVVDGNLRQSGATGTVTNAYALQANADRGSAFGKEMEIGAMVACDDDTTEREFDLVLRSSDASVTDGYWVGLNYLNDVATLKIIKRTGSSNTTAASLVVTNDMNLVSSSHDNVYQRLSARITDQDGAVRIEVRLNDEEVPILSATDTSYPLHRRGSYFGMRFSDNDTGVDGHLFVENFFTQVILAADVDFENVVDPPYWSLSSLIAAGRAIALRDSSDGTKSGVWREYANMAAQEYFTALGSPDWSEQIHSFVFPAAQQEVELPSWVDSHDDLVRLGTNSFSVNIVDEKRFREDTIFDPADSGTPYLVRVGGRGRGGGIILRPYPVPTADTSATIRVFARPRLMIEGTDMPMVPQGEAHHLVAGMIHLYSLSDNNRTKMAAWERKWLYYLRQAKKAAGRRRTKGTGKVLRPGLSTLGQVTGYSGRTRGGEWR